MSAARDLPPDAAAEPTVAEDAALARELADATGALLMALREDTALALPRSSDPETLRAQFAQLVASPNLADVDWVTNQYDRYVMGNTALSFPDDAGMVRVDEHSGPLSGVRVDQGRWPVGGVQQGHPPVQGVDQVGHARGRAGQVEVDQRGRQLVAEDDVAGQ